MDHGQRGEILAPAGGKEQLLAAVRTGADAVYLGTKGFNARRNAENFASGTLEESVSYCHARNVAVFVTVNTLVTDTELPALEETAEEIAASGADAVILQDMAALRLFECRYPTIRRFASTQTAVHNAQGALQLQEMGYHRIVLARELTLEEIRHIICAVSIETEVFIHGALCMCLSGACGLSSVIGGRSGNRGLCAQPCRLNFRSPTREYALSLKDMSLIRHIPRLMEAGVTSFKIEGRMKRPEYVAAAVTACRKARAGEDYDLEALRAVFSRGGFTEGYYRGRRTGEMFGVRGRDDVEATSAVLGALAGLYRAEYSHIPADMALTLRAGKPAELRVSSDKGAAVVIGTVPEAARTRATDGEAAKRSLEKTGGTPFILRRLTVDNPEGMAVSPAELNRMRRGALEALTEACGRTPRHERRETEEHLLPSYGGGRKALRARFETAQQVDPDPLYERVILPLREIEKEPSLLSRLGDRLVCELPAALFPEDEERLEKRLQNLTDEGLSRVLTENLYGIRLAKHLGLVCHGGSGLNILNSRALETYAGLGLADATVSWELDMRRIAGLSGSLPRGFLAYGRLPLMRVRNCPLRGDKSCGNCPGRGVLTDRTRARFPVLCDERRYSTLLNCLPVHLADREAADVDFLTLYFTTETPEECRRILEDYRLGRAYEGQRTGGLYYRTLL